MGAQQSNETMTLDKVLVEQHLRKQQMLKEELVMKSEENQFLRKRIMNELTDYANFLEEELKRQNSRTAAQAKTIEKYSQLCRKLEDDLNMKKSENESLAAENNRLLLELLLNTEENTTNEVNTERSPMFQLLKLQANLEQVKTNADQLRRRLLEEINTQKRDVEEMELSKIIYEYNNYKEKLQNQGIELEKTIFPGMEHDYRILYTENARSKVNTIKEVYRIEKDLRELSEQLKKKVAGITNDVEIELAKYDNDLQEDLMGVTFTESYRKECDFWSGLMDVARSEIKYFEKISLYGEKKSVKQDSYVKLGVDEEVKIDNIVRNEPKEWTFEVFEESEV